MLCVKFGRNRPNGSGEEYSLWLNVHGKLSDHEHGEIRNSVMFPPLQYTCTDYPKPALLCLNRIKWQIKSNLLSMINSIHEAYRCFWRNFRNDLVSTMSTNFLSIIYVLHTLIISNCSNNTLLKIAPLQKILFIAKTTL